jgi:hypothetical protein
MSKSGNCEECGIECSKDPLFGWECEDCIEGRHNLDHLDWSNFDKVVEECKPTED